jgi:aspartate carbamoyltransferase catalytic subunit
MALFQNLSDCKNLQKEEIFVLFEKAKNFKNNKIELENNSSLTRTHELGTAMCFFEASTRTKMSFETALINL